MIVLFLEILFLLISCMVFLLPVKWGVWAYILATNFHLAGLRIAAEGYSFASASSVGIGGLMTVVVLPVALMAKIKFEPIRYVYNSRVTKVWILLVLYVLLMSFFSPYFTSAVKMTAYMGWYTFVFSIFVYCWERGYFGRRKVVILFWVIFATAIIQTYVFQIFSDGKRLTTFLNVQYFGVFLVSFVSYMLFSRRGVVENLSILAALAGIFLTGSRYILVGSLMVFVVYYFLVILDLSSIVKMVNGGVKITVYSVVTILSILSIPYLFPESRMNRLIGEALLGGGGYEEVGTLVWRIGMYAEALDEISSRGALEILFGSGTSTGAEVGINFRPDRYKAGSLDANRIIHNEYIRALYEWGVFGLFLFLYSIVGAIIYFYRYLRKLDAWGAAPFVAISPLLLGSLMIENSLAGAGSIAGVSYMLLASFAYVSVRNEYRK